MANKPEDNIRYEVITHESEDGDLILPIPPQLLKQMGWKDGDELDISVGDRGQIYLKRKEK
jgi:bifunctional DNA-binding transcriptional regulator/antitoxin component of YhaV-PrlF toxin-antitoxin module